MSKREFLSKLEEALVYEMPPRAVTENLRYYSSYIDSEKGKGRSEEEVLDELGDPRLIARTIIEAEKSGEDGIPPGHVLSCPSPICPSSFSGSSTCCPSSD